MDRNPDGTFTIRFRVRDASGEVWEQTEVGLWGISGFVYFTITQGWVEDGRLQRTDPTQATFYDAYEILELDNRMFRYHAVESENEFRVERVPDSFPFPEWSDSPS